MIPYPSPSRLLIFAGLAFLSASFSLGQERGDQAPEGGLAEGRAGFATKLLKKESEDPAPEEPPRELFRLVRYKSPAGDLAAYLSPDPGDGKKHPLVIWLTGGFSNSISGIAWEDCPVENDQSAAAYRKAGIPMMYPSLRGGNDNPGFKEGYYGEVDDVLAAAKHAASLPWVDPSRIYLGGHSTGGTLALLAAEAAPAGRFRAVFSFGPSDSVAAYGQDYLPFDVKDPDESRLRAPVEFLAAISCSTLIMEGEDGNSRALEALRQHNKNDKVRIFKVRGEDHFSILGPANKLLAAKILEDKGPDCSIRINGAEVRRQCRLAREGNFQDAGNLRQKGAAAGVVFYYAPKPAMDVREAFKKAVEEEMKGMPVVSSFEEAEDPPFIVLFEEEAPLENYPVPEEDYFEHAARGMEIGDVRAIRKTESATVAVLVTPGDRILKDLKAFNRAVHSHAVKTGAFVWDSATRECFHRDAWKKKRIEGWGSSEIPDIRSQITIHAYDRGDGSGYLRGVTLGMEKLGLPDVAVERFVSSENMALGNLINVFCQSIAADPRIKDAARFEMSLDRLKPEAVAKDYRESLFENGEGKALLALMKGTPDDGDPDNAQISLDFRHGRGASGDEKRFDVVSRFWGSRDAIVPVDHDDEELQRASKAAREKLSAMKDRFKEGLPPGSRLLVKGPFTRDDEGDEWMWIEVMKWSEDDVLSGSLQNSPFHIKDLKAGAMVEVKLADAFDYILYHSDGTEEGNATGAIMRKQQENRGQDD